MEIKKEVVQEIWRVDDTKDTIGFTCTVMYPLPHIAYIKGFRGNYNREIRKSIKENLLSKGITELHYERCKSQGVQRMVKKK